jgi:hypothetical protein
MPETTVQHVDNNTHPDGGAKILRYFSTFLFVMALLSCLAFAFLSVDAVRMAIFGADGQATIVDMRTDTYRTIRTYGGGSGTVLDARMRTDYYVTYKFAVDGQQYQRERRVSEAFYRDLSTDEQFPVRYLLGNPEENYIDKNWVSWSIITPALIAFVLFGTGYLFRRVAKIAAKNAALNQEDSAN